MGIYDKNATQLNDCYTKNSVSIDTAYDKNGAVVFQKSTPSPVDYDNYTITNYVVTSFSAMVQGFDIYNGVIFQMLANNSGVNNRMATINIEESSIINNNVAIISGHGDSATFSDEFYNPNDEYPLLYVTADTNPAKIYINRVTPISSELIKTLSFPLAITGYYAALCLDCKHNIGYMVGYKNNSATSSANGNKMIVSKWDMTNFTENQDGSFTPEFISSYERDFIYVSQGQQFHDGMLWISSGGTNVRGYVYALNPEDGTLLHTIDSGTTTEMEGISFISDTEMVFGLQYGTYKKVTFASNNR